MTLSMRVLISILLASIVICLLYYFCSDLSIIPEYYAKNMRGSLFTGFLTVGSFLLSLKAFIVVKLKENIFDTDGYKNRLKERRRINQKLTLYGPVKRLSHLLFISISSSIAASVSQFSIGLIPDWKATFVCIFLAIFAISMLISTLLLIKGLLDEWLNYLEDAHDKTVENSK